MQTKITCFDKVREDLRRTLKFVGDVSFIFFLSFVHYDPQRSRMSVYMTCFVLKSEILTPPTPGYASITVSANGKTLKFEHARYWPLSKLSENCSLSEPQMYQNTTQKHPQNGSQIEEIMENRAPEHSSRSPIDQHATFNTTRGGSGSPEWRTGLDLGTLRSAPILNTPGPPRTPSDPSRTPSA